MKIKNSPKLSHFQVKCVFLKKLLLIFIISSLFAFELSLTLYRLKILDMSIESKFHFINLMMAISFLFQMMTISFLRQMMTISLLCQMMTI